MKTQTQEESHVKAEADVRVMCLESEEHQGWPASARSPEISMELVLSVGTNPTHTSSSDFWLPELGENTFLLC